jgi:hypothetical protein
MIKDAFCFHLILVVFFLILLAGCSHSSPAEMTPAPAGSMPLHTGNPSSNPISVYILYPDFDGGVDTGDVTVMVLVRNFSVVNRIGERNSANEGHLVYFKDVTPPTTPGVPVTALPGTFQISASTWYTWHNVSSDTHTFAVELVNNDNTPFTPPVIDAVDVTAVNRSAQSAIPSGLMKPAPD